jgi:hypothetical protein
MLTIARLIKGKTDQYEFINMEINVEIFNEKFANKIYFDPLTDIQEESSFHFSYDVAESFIKNNSTDESIFAFMDNPKTLLDTIEMVS